MSKQGLVTTEIIVPREVDVSAQGDNTVLAAPTKGRRVFGVTLSCPVTNLQAIIVILKFGAGGATLVKVSMSPGDRWTYFVGGGSRSWASGIATFVANLSAAQTVFVSVEAEDF